jgi:hypothetical protein
MARMNSLQEQESTPSLEMGTLVHALVLEPEVVYSNYIMKPDNLKTPSSGQQAKLCDKIIEEGHDFEEGVSYFYGDFYSIKGKTETAIKKAVTTFIEDFKPYFEFLKEAEGKIMLTHDDYEKANLCKQSLALNDMANSLLWWSGTHYNEQEVYFEYEGVDCKSKIDKIVIDDDNKKIKLVDLKTTSKNVYNFGKSVEYYDYDRQLYFYTQAVRAFLGDKYKDYEIECYFVVVQTTSLNESAVYLVSEGILERGKEKFTNLFNRLKFHLDTQNFEVPIEFQEKGYMTLEIEKDAE